MKGNRKEREHDATRMELKYCERCGGLWLREIGGEAVYCDRCKPLVADLPSSPALGAVQAKKGPGRVTLPVAPPSVVEDYEAEWCEEEELDAAGGVA